MITIFAFSSCKKSRTCECNANGETYRSDLSKSKEDDAEAACNNTEASLKATTDPNASCILITGK